MRGKIFFLLLMVFVAFSCKMKNSTRCSFNLCGDFEDNSCFSTYWNVDIPSGSETKLDKTTSHNNSTSLHFTNQYFTGAINLPTSEMNRYIDCIETNKIYQVKWWGKYKGYMPNDNRPVMYISIEQDGNWLDYKYVGISNGSWVDVDWQLYSFQFTTNVSTPVKLMFGTNIQDCWIDDITVTKL